MNIRSLNRYGSLVPLWISQLVLGTLLISSLSACQKLAQPAQENGVETGKKIETSTPYAIRLPCAVAKLSNVSRSLVIPGVVAPLPDHAIKVSAALAGKLVMVSVIPGQKVQKQQLIARLDDRHIKDQLEQADVVIQAAQGAITQAENNLKFAKENLDRTRKLFSAEVAAKKDILLAENQVQSAESQLAAAKAQVTTAQTNRKQFLTELTLTEVRSPLTGVVAVRYLNVGDTADLNTPIAQIIQLDRVAVNAALPADSSAKVETGQHAKVKDVGQSDFVIDAVVTAVSPVVDSQSNTINVELQCENQNHELRDGQSVSVNIASSVDHHKILIPKSALVPDPNNPNADMVYVIKAAKASRVPVKTGVTIGTDVEILNGINAGETFIIQGAYGLPDQSHIEQSPH